MEAIVLKIIGSGMIIVACGGFGAYPVRRMSIRINEMELFYFCLLRLKSEICHTMDSLPDALLNASQNAERKGSLYAKAFRLFSEKLREGGERYEVLLEHTIAEVFTENVITGEEIESFRRMFLSLGGADKERQAGILGYYSEQVLGRMNEEKQKKKERGYLYRSMGVLLGVFLTVVLL